ncbi:MAG: ketoacyl-ACP synthase III [Verrucomicrobia bacterium]|nr:ketoacyl-ACP synthase III [Verrucomicrobiota bacterium]
MRTVIRGIGSYVPEKILSNADLEKMVDTNDEWIMTRTGISERRIAKAEETPSTMGLIAAKQALEAAGIKVEELDLIVVATCTPDYLFPSTAALIQGQLGAVNAAVLDFQAACSGYIYGISMADAYIRSGFFKNILVIASEKLTAFVDWEDRGTCILFGDGAAAAVLANGGEGLLIEAIDLGADGKEAMIVTMLGGGSCMPPSLESVAAKAHSIRMEGSEVFKHAVRRMIQSSLTCLERAKLSIESIRWLVPHQANKRIIEGIAKRLDVSMEKVYLTVQKYGNTSASSIGLALKDLIDEHGLEKEDRVLLTAFGSGLTWGSAILRRV